jgi:tRNA A-37 threonylcarbamoyl transferase component Bud32
VTVFPFRREASAIPFASRRNGKWSGFNPYDISMTATRPCPACGTPLPADTPAGLCPRCLAAGGPATAASPSAAGFDPPVVGDLAPLFPQLELLDLLGAGGMGAVYKARQPGLDRLVALKVLPSRDDPAFAERFTREARALAKLNHSGIVHVYDFGQAGGHYFIVMEYVDGVNLRQAERSGKMTPAEALAVVPQICAALQYAHEVGVIHRDVKPENILLDARGRVKIADFGLAKLLGEDPRHLTRTHQAMGTLHYMAPEQWERPTAVDHRADIYSLGVVFYELLTGELPLGRFAPPSEKARVDVRLDRVVLRALEKEPDRRYQRAEDVKTDVEQITAAPITRGDAKTDVDAAAFIDRAGGGPPRRWTVLGVAALLLIVAAVCAWPVGIIALPSLWWVARQRQRSMVSVAEGGLRSLGLDRAATWTIVLCALGVLNALWPWLSIENYGTRVIVFGFDARATPYPPVIATGYLALGLFFFVTGQLPRLRPWRAGVALLGGGALAALTIVFVHTANNVSDWDMRMKGAFGPRPPRDFHLLAGPGPYFAVGLGIGLMIIGAIELRGHLANRTVNGASTPAR